MTKTVRRACQYIVASALVGAAGMMALPMQTGPARALELAQLRKGTNMDAHLRARARQSMQLRSLRQRIGNSTGYRRAERSAERARDAERRARRRARRR